MGVLLVFPLPWSRMLLYCRLQISTARLCTYVCREGDTPRLPEGEEHGPPGTHIGHTDILWFFLFLARLSTVVGPREQRL